MAEIVMEDLSKVYSDGTTAVSNLNLGIADGEFIVLVGPSGCGKTTALRMVAGLESISGGTVRIGDRVVNTVPPKERDIAMVFQNYALYPHMSVYDNMAFGLKLRKLPKEEIDRRVREAADILGLEEFLQRKPKALSGGQRQRVAMGRAIVREPKAFLMDEPLSNLDAKLRVQMRSEIARIQHELSVTTIYVTHDQVEAMTMGDRVAVIRKGILQQVGAPQYLYDHPSNLFVAGFIGSPAMNLVEAAVSRSDGGAKLEFGGFELGVPEGVFGERPALRGYEGKRVIVGIRPEDMAGHRGRAGGPGRPQDPVAGEPARGARGRRPGALQRPGSPGDHRGRQGARARRRRRGAPGGRGAGQGGRVDLPREAEPQDGRDAGRTDRPGRRRGPAPLLRSRDRPRHLRGRGLSLGEPSRGAVPAARCPVSYWSAGPLDRATRSQEAGSSLEPTRHVHP